MIRSAIMLALLLLPAGSQAAVSPKTVERATETEVRNLIEPILSKYCNEQCKVLAVDAAVDISPPEETAPGFNDAFNEEFEPRPSSVKVKMLIDEMVGPHSRSKIFDLIQEYIDVLDYPVYIETKVTRFPQPLNSAKKVAKLRDDIAKKFRTTLQKLFAKFCPEQCMLADLDVRVDPVNAEEVQYGATGEFIQDGDTTLKVRKITGTILLDETLNGEEQANITEMAALQTNSFKNVDLDTKVMKFPHPLAYSEDGRLIRGPDGKFRKLSSKNLSKLKSKSLSSSKEQSTLNSSSKNQRDDRYERYEKIERVEDGDRLYKDFEKLKLWGSIFAASVIFLLMFLVVKLWLPNSKLAMTYPSLRKIAGKDQDEFTKSLATGTLPGMPSKEESKNRADLVIKRYEIERLKEELTKVYAENPKVAKQVFSRVLKEEGVEITANYVAIFGEAIVVDMLRDPSLQRDVNDLMEFYAKNQIEINDEDELELLRALHNRTVAAKLVVAGNRSSNLFDFLVEMDALQIMDLVKNESLTVKAIIMTQCDAQKQNAIFNHFDEHTKMKLLTELSRIDHLPRDYIYNVATALKRKRQENPRLNTEALPGSDVLVGLLEKTDFFTQKSVLTSLETTNPDSARNVKAKLVSIDTLAYVRDAQLLEIVLSLKHEELVQFLKGCPKHIRDAIFAKSPRDLVEELEEELRNITSTNREMYSTIERKVVNRIKVMSNDGNVNLLETNERMFTEEQLQSAESVELKEAETEDVDDDKSKANLKKVAGW